VHDIKAKPGVSNLIEILAVIRGVDHAAVERDFEGQQYGAFKQAVADEVVEFLRPVRERYEEIRPDEAAIGNDPTPTLVKRLIGMPGDTLYMRDGLVYANGIAQRQGFGAEKNMKGDPNSVDPLFEWQKRYALANSRFGAAPSQPTHDNWGPLVVPAGHYFMMGDNRYCSKDSRYWGVVPRENVRGQPLFVYYSYTPGPEKDPPQPWCEYPTSFSPVPAITDIRWGRIGTRIR
jgi:signal peptidase I